VRSRGLAIVRLVARHAGILAEPRKAVGPLDEESTLRLRIRSGSHARLRACGAAARGSPLLRHCRRATRVGGGRPDGFVAWPGYLGVGISVGAGAWASRVSLAAAASAVAEVACVRAAPEDGSTGV
jgi:hypothetical protein